jgi:hypothetical protein
MLLFPAGISAMIHNHIIKLIVNIFAGTCSSVEVSNTSSVDLIKNFECRLHNVDQTSTATISG